jgi:DNA-binding LacI/PurR family transcriptional regulator
MKSTIRDVARAASVAVSTASMALNNKPGVSEKTKKKVRMVARELCYVPNHSARSLVTNDSKCLGLMVPEIVNPFYSAIVDKMATLAEGMGYTLLLGISNNKSNQEKAFVKTFASHRVLGVIIVPMLCEKPNTEHLDILKTARIPTIFCTDYYDEWTNGVKGNYSCVMCDLEQGEYEMIRHLIKLGHKEICFVSVDMDVHFTQLRQRGYQRAYEQEGLAADENRVFFADQARFQGGYDIADVLLKQNPDAIACINDIMTIGILKRLNERGVRIPEDIAVAGFDDMMFAELAQKPISTVRQPLQRICERTLEMLDKKIKKQKGAEESGKIILEKPELIIRSTT